MLNLSRWPEADLILEQAVVLPRDARRAFIHEAARGDRALEEALATVLDEDGRDDGFLSPGGALSGSLFDDLCREDVPEAPALQEGATLGPYRVDRRIGRGGMGEVYRARDVRLGRDVALKVLPEHLARDADRVARFAREARALAAVSHPGIGSIFDVYERPGVVALVLELVEGPTLADRLANGPLGLDAALSIARQLVDALDAAHERGIVHRDLKPANVKVAADGTVKVLDFGLARAVGDEDDPTTGKVLPSITTSHAGVVFGTASYMSPEQARGQRVDHRTDIWAFGCLLFEMLAGERAFGGETPPDILAKVIERDADLSRLSSSTPPALVRLIERCLQKDVRRRLGYIGDARLDLDEAEAQGERPRRAAIGTTRQGARYGAVAALVAAAIAGGVLARWSARSTTGPSLQLSVPLPSDHELVVGQLSAVEVSSHAPMMVYRAVQKGVMQLFARALDATDASAIPGTENAAGHAVSPDGRWVVFGRDGRLFKTRIAGGPPVVLSEGLGGVNVVWAPDHSIVFSTGAGRSIARLPEGGGTPTPLTHVDGSRGEQAHTSPSVSPDGTLAFTIEYEDRTEIAIVRGNGGAVTVLTQGRQPRFLAADLLVFVRQRSLWGVGFDSRQMAITSEPVPILDGLDRSSLNGEAHFAVGGDGALLYIPDRSITGRQSLVWRDRQGRDAGVEAEGQGFVRFALSPDASRIAIAMSDGRERDVWILDRTRKTLSRLTTEPAAESAPVWSADASTIAYRFDGDGGGIVTRTSDGAGAPRRLTRANGLFHIPYAFAPDGQLLFVEFRDYRDQNILTVSTGESAQITPVLAGRSAESRPALSPDARWLAYQADESGRGEVYVRPWPDVSRAKWQVSSTGGSSPVWRRDGRELFFAAGDTIMAAAVDAGAAFRAAVPTALFKLDTPPDRLGAFFDVSADGSRFLVMREPRPASGAPSRLHLVTGWAAEVRARLAATR